MKGRTDETDESEINRKKYWSNCRQGIRIRPLDRPRRIPVVAALDSRRTCSVELFERVELVESVEIAPARSGHLGMACQRLHASTDTDPWIGARCAINGQSAQDKQPRIFADPRFLWRSRRKLLKPAPPGRYPIDNGSALGDREVNT